MKIKLTKEQSAWCAQYQRMTGFEPTMATDAKTFTDFAKANLNWFIQWAQEQHQILERPVITGELV